MVHLEPLTPEGFEAYRRLAAAEYARLALEVEKFSPPGSPLPGQSAIEQRLPQGASETSDQRLYQIHLDGGQPVGFLWADLAHWPNAAVVPDILIEASSRRRGFATLALQALEALLVEMGGKRIYAEIYGENQAAMGLFLKLGYTLTNIHMLRDLSHPRPPQSRSAPAVYLASIDEPTYQSYLMQTIHDYAEDKIQAGNWKAEDALERAREEYNQLLPAGRQTPGHMIYSIIAEKTGEKTGVLWWGPLWEGKVAFIYDFVVYETWRGKGYAKSALFALEDIVRAAGHPVILLHVFAHNHTARALYEKVGYINVVHNLKKPLA